MDKTRYHRNILVEGMGMEGQERLQASKVLVIGAGGLGSPVLYYLAAAGIGTLGIVDHDVVDISNLQRQILHCTNDIGKYKVDSAAEKLQALNPDIQFQLYPEAFTETNAKQMVESYDFIIDCCDNYTTKFLIDDICVATKKPYSHGAVLSMQGETMTYIPGSTCYRDIFTNIPEDSSKSSSQAGIIGSIAGIIGCIQATEAIKYIAGLGELIVNRLLIFDGRTMQFRTLQI